MGFIFLNYGFVPVLTGFNQTFSLTVDFWWKVPLKTYGHLIGLYIVQTFSDQTFPLTFPSNEISHLQLGSRDEHLWLNIVNQSESNYMASDWINFSYHSLVTDSARL